MSFDADVGDLRASLARLREHGVVPGVARALSARRDVFVDELVGVVTGEVAAYSESANPDVVPELASHLGDIVSATCDLLAGHAPGPLDFVTEHARRRAAQKFPLDAILHAYRCTHRDLSRWIRDAAVESADKTAHVRRVVAAVTDFAVEFTGVLGTRLTTEYVTHTRALAQVEGDRRTRLVDFLLYGYDESDHVAARLLRRAGYLEQRQSYCVAVARSVEAREMENPARAQRMADAVADALANAPFRLLTGVRGDLVFAIVSGTRRLSGWTAPQSILADRVHPLLLKVGPAALIGLSNDVPSTSHIPRAAQEAQLALDFTDVAHRVMAYSQISFRQMLITHAREPIQSALPAWFDRFTAFDAKSQGSLTATLRAYADADMNVLRTAKALGIHSNTVYARMRRIRELTDLDPLEYHALTEMLLACDCAGP